MTTDEIDGNTVDSRRAMRAIDRRVLAVSAAVSAQEHIAAGNSTAGVSEAGNSLSAGYSQCIGNTAAKTQEVITDTSHIQCIIDSIPAELTEEQRIRAAKFIEDNTDLFSRSEFDIGRTNLEQHTIETGHSRPFKQQLRRHPLAHLPIIDQHVEQMLKHDIIEPTSSPWSSNVVLIKKSDNEYRFCIDYRRLNSLTLKDSYPLPRIDSCFDSLGGATYFTTLDLRQGYWQLELDPKTSDRSAFVTRRGCWKFKVLSYGLCNAPACFQRLMDRVLAGLTWEICLAFLDDIVIFFTNV